MPAGTRVDRSINAMASKSEATEAAREVELAVDLQSQAHRADAYSSFAVTLGLVFGFSSTMLFEIEVTNEAGALLLSSSIVLAFCVATSGYGMIVCSMQFYHLKRLIGNGNEQELIAFMSLKSIKRSRNLAKMMLPLSLSSLLCSVMLKFASACSDKATVITVSSILICTVLVLLIQEVHHASISLKFKHEASGH